MLRRRAPDSPRTAASALVILLVAALAGCSNTAGGPTPGDTGAATSDVTGPTSSPGTAPGLSDSAARDLLAQYDPGAAAELDELALHRRDPSLLAAARDAIEAGATGGQRWAAVYVWVNEGDDSAPLLTLLTADDAEIRLMAAIGLLARGRSEGFPPLLDLLVDDSETSGVPPVLVWQRAATALARYTAVSELGPQLDGDAASRQAARNAWQAWFDEHAATLTFDTGEGLWRAA
ncbi:MAG: hypothetical protein Q7V88_09590 [Actinomycetota bacterium]|nr:hypothetical protein [Actinomycetota bacterium]